MVDNPKNHKYTRVAEEEMNRKMLEFELPESMGGAEEDGKRKKG